MLNGIYLILLLPILYALIAFNDWYFIKTVIKKHYTYIIGLSSKATREERKASALCADWITSNMSEIRRRVKKSGIDDPTLSYIEPKGYGHVAKQNMSVINNLLYVNKDVQDLAFTTLKRVRGYYLSQAKRSLSPLFWLETILFLPKALFNASGIESTSKIAESGIKITQLIYWIIVLWVVVTKPELITSILSKVKL